MAQEKLENLSLELLTKRKKFAIFLIGVMIGIILVTVVIFGMSLADGKNINLTLYLPALFLVFFILFMYSGVKKINSELKRRDSIK